MVTLTLRLANNDEKTISWRAAPPTQISVSVIPPANNLGLNTTQDNFNLQFSGKTFTRVAETLVYEEDV